MAMDWMGKAKAAVKSADPVPTRSGPAFGSSSAPVANPSSNVRISNGLKEFLWLISDKKNGRILDLGPAFQNTIMFFIEKGFKLSTEDMLRSWKEFITEEEESFRKSSVGAESVRISRASLAEKFLKTSVIYPDSSFDGILAWDLFDYLDGELLVRVMDRLYNLLAPGGSVLSIFHSKTPDRYTRYKIVDGQNIELVPAPTVAVHARIFQNREILDIFGKFRSSKTFVGRDQVREGLFLK
ncbi:MAG: class I SAM-dependent methyltransferase [Candidatus Acidiferrales bacterium]